MPLSGPSRAICALTVRPHWAWAIAHAGKDVENRSWKTDHRGLLAIHASNKSVRARDREMMEKRYGLLLPDELPRGQIVCTVRVRDCVRGHPSRWAIAGQWHWLLGRVRRLREPVTAKGRLRLWTCELPARRKRGRR
jgi:hypothetical protein